MATEQPTGNNPDVVPTPSRGFPAPIQGRRFPRGPMIIIAVVGLVAGGALASGAWLLFGNDGASSSPIAAPERLGDYVPQAEAGLQRTTEQGRKVARQWDDWDRQSGERLSDTHDGASAIVQKYTNHDLDTFFSLEVVRAPVPFPPYVPYSDPEVLGFDKPSEEVRMYDDVACAMQNSPSESFVTLCVRSDDELTVRITHTTGDLAQDPKAMAGLVAAAWDELA